MNILKMEFRSMIWSEVGIQHDFGGGNKKFVSDTAEEAGGVIQARQRIKNSILLEAGMYW